MGKPAQGTQVPVTRSRSPRKRESVQKSRRLIRQWAPTFGFGMWNITVGILPVKEWETIWAVGHWSSDEEAVTFLFQPDHKIDPDAHESLVIHELAHGLMRLAERSEAGEEVAVNRVVRLILGQDARLINERLHLTNLDQHFAQFQNPSPSVVTNPADRQRAWLPILVDGLTEQERFVVTALTWDEQSLAQVGRQLGLSKRSVARVRERAIGKLRAAYVALGEGAEWPFV